MCGIMAYASKKPCKSHVDACLRAAAELLTRGVHSFGISYVDFGALKTVKSLTPLPRSVFESAVFSGSFIYHNRYSTSGDYLDENNNQPIGDEEISVAVNGVTSMLTKPEYEAKFGVSCNSGNDSEVILMLLKQNLSWTTIINNDIGSLSCAVIRKNKKVVVIRNHYRPLRVGVLAGDNPAAFACSTSCAMFNGIGSVGVAVQVGKEVVLQELLGD